MIEVLFFPDKYRVYMGIGKDQSQYPHFFKIKNNDEYHFENVLFEHKIDYILYGSAQFPWYMAFKTQEDLNAAIILY